MIDDLSILSPETILWKHVDDVSISECLTKNGGASIQSKLDTVSSWSSMNLNAKNCKELQVFFFFLRRPRSYPLYELMVKYWKQFSRSYEVLGLVIQDNLKWNEHIGMIVSKESKRLHIIRVLRTGGVMTADLVIYVTLVRSFLEYCYVVGHNALPA